MIKPLGTLILMTTLAFMACRKSEAVAPTNAAPEKPLNVFYVRTTPLTQSVNEDAIQVTGIIQSDSEAKPSFKTGGVIARMYVEEGDVVKKGQLIAQLNLTEIEAQTTQAGFALEKAERDLRRVENLYRDSIATLEQFQNATTAVDVAKKSLQIAQFNLAYSQVYAPIDGKVIKKLMHEGEITGPGIPIYFIMGVNPSDWKLVAGLTDKNWGRIKMGDAARVTLDAYPGWTMACKVKRLSDVANPMSGTFDVELAIPAGDKRIAAGMLAHVEIVPSAKTDYTVIPIEALVSSNGRNGIVYVPKDNKAEKRHVVIQQFYGEEVAILSGLEGATEVITAGSGFLEDGDAIVIE